MFLTVTSIVGTGYASWQAQKRFKPILTEQGSNAAVIWRERKDTSPEAKAKRNRLAWANVGCVLLAGEAFVLIVSAAEKAGENYAAATTVLHSLIL